MPPILAWLEAAFVPGLQVRGNIGLNLTCILEALSLKVMVKAQHRPSMCASLTVLQMHPSKHSVQAAIAAGGVLSQLPVPMQDHWEAIVAGSVAAEVEAAGHHMNVLLMLVSICIQHILVPQRESPLGIVESDYLIPVSAKLRHPNAVQAQQQHASIQPKFAIVG